MAGAAPNLGVVSLDLRPFCGAGVTKMITPSSGGSAPTYQAVVGVKVAVSVQHTDGRIYKVLTRIQGLSQPTALRLITLIIRRLIAMAADPPVLISKLQMRTSDPTFHSTNQYSTTPFFNYDPYFGRDPSHLKNVQYLVFTLTFPSGKKWSVSISCANNSKNSTTGRLSTVLNTSVARRRRSGH